MAFPKKVALGKQGYKYDARTIVLGAHLQPEAEPPDDFDYDHGKKAFPLEMWGNDDNGDCVFVCDANGLVRMERKETRRTIPITTDVVLGKYRSLTGSKQAGDAYDAGYVMLDAFRDWKNEGWTVGKKTYTIDAYGELDKNNLRQLHRAIWLLGGIFTGFGLPLYVAELVRAGEKTWDIPSPNDDSPENQPYSWGGHAMYAKRYDQGGIYFLTWGQEVYLTNAFIARYCDEVWAAVDALDSHSRYLDVDALEKILKGLAQNVQAGVEKPEGDGH